MNKRLIVLGLTAVIGGLAWYWFRPELLFIDFEANEQPAALTSESAVVARGAFHAVAHDGKGTATVYRTATGRHVLRLTDFATSNGPALHVYLIAAEDAADSAAVQAVEAIDLGKLKGNVGDQNYELPAEYDPVKFRALTIWCKRFSVNFATAPLLEPASP